jgi:hypothetical protein
MTSPASLEGGGLRVVFTRQGDRYAHSVFRVNDGLPTNKPGMGNSSASTTEVGFSSGLLLESIEGTPDDDWPASPALRELHFEDRADGRRLALLVGMAGKSHWSLSVELDAAHGHLVFDVACRLRSPPVRLGSRYRLPAAGSGDSARSSAGCPQTPLTIEPVDSGVVRLVTSADRQLHIEPAAVAGPWPRTVRWRYVVRA